MTTRPSASSRRTPRRAPVSPDRASADRLPSIEAPAPPRRQRDVAWLRRLLAFATCVLLANALFGDGGLGELLRARQQYQAVYSELAWLRQENAVLRERARRLAGDTATIEGVARDELGLMKRGEVVVTVRDLEPGAPSR